MNMTQNVTQPTTNSLASKPGPDQDHSGARRKKAWWQYFTPYIPRYVKDKFLAFDRKVDGAASFFIKHWGKSRFMIAMSKKAQYLGLERLWMKGPKAFIYFFLFYLIRDTILYIIIPIFVASLTTS